MRWCLGRALVLGLLCGGLVACSDDDDGGVTDGGGTDGGGTDGGVTDGGVTDGGVTDGGTAQNAGLRLIHASPDAPAVDVYATGRSQPLATSLTYGAASTRTELPAGSYTFEVRPAGAASTTTPVFTSPAVTLAAGQEETIIAAGLLSSTDAATNLRAIPLQEQFAAPESGKARVRFIHASPDAPTPVGIDVGADGSQEASIARFADSGAAGVSVTAGAPIQIALTTGTPATRLTTFTLPALTAGTNHQILVTGLAARPPRETNGLALLDVDADSAETIRQNPQVYVLHAGPDAPAIDLFAGQSEVASDLAYGRLSSPLSVPPGDRTIDLFPASSGTTRPSGSPAFSANLSGLTAGERYLAVATGLLSATPAFRIVPVRDAFNADPASSRVRFIHAAPGVGTVSIGPRSNGTISAVFSDVPFGQASDAAAGELLTPGAVTWGVLPAGQSTPVADFALNFAGGAAQYAVAIGEASGKPLQLVLVDTTASPWSTTTVEATTP
jgi:hypothetical protein